MRNIIFIVLFVACVNVASAQYTAVRVNALALATGTINAGVDITVSDKWSVDLSAMWSSVSTSKHSINALAFTAGARRWRFEPNVGLFYGAHSTVSRYEVDSRIGLMVGVGSSIGYSWILSRRWNFSLEGGIGVFYLNDQRLQLDTSPLEDIIIRHHRRVVLAPSKLEISFSYLL